jgi:hypothetical protein
METGEEEAFAFVCAVIRGFQKTIRTIFEDAARGGQMQLRREENSEDVHQAAPAPSSSDGQRRRCRRKRASEEPDSPESSAMGTEKPGSRLDTVGTAMVDQQASEPSVERRIREWQDRVGELEQRNDHLEGTNTALRDRLRRWYENEEAELKEWRVFVQCGKVKRTLPWKNDQKWASFRKRLIRTFKLKNSYWELEDN